MTIATLDYSWRDQFGREFANSMPVAADAASDELAEELRLILQALTDSSIVGASISYTYPRDPSDVAAAAATDTTMSVKDVVILVFRSSVGKLVKVAIIKPLVAVLTNDEVVNKAHALVTAIEDAAKLYLKDNGGNAIIELVRGYRSRNKKKISE